MFFQPLLAAGRGLGQIKFLVHLAFFRIVRPGTALHESACAPPGLLAFLPGMISKRGSKLNASRQAAFKIRASSYTVAVPSAISSSSLGPHYRFLQLGAIVRVALALWLR
jgi:hypothetical protein